MSELMNVDVAWAAWRRYRLRLEAEVGEYSPMLLDSFWEPFKSGFEAGRQYEAGLRRTAEDKQ